MGSLRHYFASQSELMVFAFRTVIDRIESRLARLEPESDPRRRAERVLAELLPLDDERRAENELWLAFTSRAMVDPALGDLRDEGYDALQPAAERSSPTSRQPVWPRPTCTLRPNGYTPCSTASPCTQPCDPTSTRPSH